MLPDSVRVYQCLRSVCFCPRVCTSCTWGGWNGRRWGAAE